MRIENLYLKHLAAAFVARGHQDVRDTPESVDGPADAAAPTHEPDFDWDLLLKQLLDHKVFGALSPLVDEQQLTGAQRQRLGDAGDDFKRRTTLLLLELERILPSLEQAGCQPVVLKGAAIASGVYPTPSARYFLDLDILVAKEMVSVACKVLEQCGYTFRQDGNDPVFYQKHHFHWIMHNAQGSCVEVHWALTMPESIFNFDLAGLRQRAELIPFGQGTMRVPSAQDQVLHTVLQCIADGFSDLRRILDAALLLRRVDDVPGLITQAQQQGLAIGLWILLETTQAITDVEINTNEYAVVAPGTRRGRCLAAMRIPESCLERLALEQPSLVHLMHCLCVPTLRQLNRELLRYVFPGEGRLLEMGYRVEKMPGWWRRMTISLGRLRALVYQASFLITRLSRARGTSRKEHHPPPETASKA